MKRQIDCVIFDMDGVIVNTEPLHKKAYFNTFKELNLNVSDKVYHSLTGSSTENAFKKLIDYYNLNYDVTDLIPLKRKHFKELFTTDDELALIEGVLDLIKDLHQKGKTLILASSASMHTINAVFTKFDLDKYFLKKLSGADLKASKPHPEIFELAAKHAGFPKENCIVIEDSDNGILASNNANIFCVGYKSEHSKMQTLENADMVIEDFSELIQSIK
jgi:HAD superfamily hydrolase (TIGR01509 family)